MHRFVTLCLALGLVSACATTPDAQMPVVQQAVEIEQAEQQVKPKLGLFTTLPIYWGEGGAIDAILASGAERDWVRAELERDFEIVPLDTLEAEQLGQLNRVFLAQPRPLAPSENVSFDAFIARGGQALIMADPRLTRHSEYAIGDRRRPQDVALLSPILARLGARLEYDDMQQGGPRLVEADEVAFPVNQAGRFVSVPSDVVPDGCAVKADAAILARCERGEGVVYLFADAALLDWEEDAQTVPAEQRAAFRALLQPLVQDSAR